MPVATDGLPSLSDGQKTFTFPTVKGEAVTTLNRES